MHELWTYDRVAEFFGVGRRTIERWTKKGLTPIRFSPKIVRFDPADVQAYAERKKSQQSDQLNEHGGQNDYGSV